MGVSDEFLIWVLDQLKYVGPVTARRMFGGAGIYLEKMCFGLVADDVLYFKVDEGNRADYEALGLEPFRPYADQRMAMSYYELPADILEDRDKLRVWADKALGAAERGKKKKKKKKKS